MLASGASFPGQSEQSKAKPTKTALKQYTAKQCFLSIRIARSLLRKRRGRNCRARLVIGDSSLHEFQRKKNQLFYGLIQQYNKNIERKRKNAKGIKINRVDFVGLNTVIGNEERLSTA